MEPAIARERAHSSAADIFRSPPPGRIEPGLASLVRLCAKPAWGAASRVSPNPAPLLLPIYAIWHDGYGVGLPRNSPIRPDRIIRLSELLL